MIAPATPKQEKILQLVVELTDTVPSVWRRLLVPASYSLGELHDIIQALMPWEDYHCHMFRVGERRYGEPNEEMPAIEDEEALTLADVFRAKCRQIAYVYDFGDGWQHTVMLEKRLQPDLETEYPVCVGGENASPPEDSGGVAAYYEKLVILRDPTHHEHDRVVEWMGADFDPTHFDLSEANEALRYDPSTPEPGEDVEDVEPVSSAEVEGLCAWCGRRIPAEGPAITFEMSVCQRFHLVGLEGSYVLVPMSGGDARVPALVPEGAGSGQTVVASLCCEPCAEALRSAWGTGGKETPPDPGSADDDP
jgi:hypothetical protein